MRCSAGRHLDGKGGRQGSSQLTVALCFFEVCGRVENFICLFKCQGKHTFGTFCFSVSQCWGSKFCPHFTHNFFTCCSQIFSRLLNTLDWTAAAGITSLVSSHDLQGEASHRRRLRNHLLRGRIRLPIAEECRASRCFGLARYVFSFLQA